MKITFEPTDKIVHLNGLPARLWQGVTEHGVPCHAYITRVAVAHGLDASEFERALQETAPARPGSGLVSGEHPNQTIYLRGQDGADYA